MPSYAVPQLWPLYHVYLCCYLNLAHFSVSQDKQVSIVSSAVNRGQHCLKMGDAFTKTWTSADSMSAQRVSVGQTLNQHWILQTTCNYVKSEMYYSTAIITVYTIGAALFEYRANNLGDGMLVPVVSARYTNDRHKIV